MDDTLKKTTDGPPLKGAQVEMQDTKPSYADTPSATANEIAPPKSNGDDAIEFPGPVALTLITVALALAVFLTALDNLIIATAIPFITTQFNSLDDVGWYGASYLITTGGFQLMFGKLYIIYPIKWVFLTSITIFEIGSLVCGVAPNSIALIIGRAIAGIGSAGLFSGAMVIISYAVPLTKRPMFFAVFGAVFAVASVVGPLLGGVFTDKATWRWCFYINLPIGAVTIGVICLILKHPKQEDMSNLGWKERIQRLDFPGNALFMALVICFLLAIQWGGIEYPWANARIIVLFILAGTLTVVFVFLQSKLQEKATVPPRITKKRSIWACCFFAFFLTGSVFFAIFYLPIWFQAVQGVSAVQSGIRNIPLILAMTVASFIGGAIVAYLGYYTPLMIIGCAIVTVGQGLLSTLETKSSSGAWIGYQVVVGFGVGAAQQQTLLAVQTVLSQKDIPIGTALVIFSQTLGGAVAVAIGQAIFRQELLKNIIKFTPGIDPNLVINLGASNIQKGLPAEYLAGVRQAYNDAIGTAFYVGVAFAAAGTISACMMEWKNLKGVAEEQQRNKESAPSSDAQREENPQQLPGIRKVEEEAVEKNDLD